MSTFHDTTNLRLEIEVPTTGLPNLIQNPSGDLGGWGWITPVTNTLVTSDSTALTFKTTVSQASYYTSEFMAVAASQYVAARFDLVSITASHNVKVRYEWYNASKVLLSSSTQSSALSAVQTHYYSAVQAPANTAYVKIRFDFYNGAGNPSANATFVFNKAMVTHAATSGAIQTVRTNLVTNPSIEVNTTGWTVGTSLALTRSATVARTGTYSLRVNNTNNIFNLRAVTNVTTGITGGSDYALLGSLYKTANVTDLALQVWWYASVDASGTAISYNSLTTPSVSGWNDMSGVFTAPSGANSATVEVYFGKSGGLTSTDYGYVDKVMLEKASAVGTYFDGSTVSAGKTYAWTGTAHASTSTETTSSYAFIEPTQWQNILGPTHEIKINRRGLDVGLMSATILDALLDPSVSDTIRPGKKIRVQTYSSDAEYPYITSNWESLFEGILTSANVTYDKDKVVGSTVETRIQISASDAIATLANQGESRGVANMTDLPYIMEGKGVPWSINGNGNQVTSATVVSINANASILDQIAITRDTNSAYACVNRQGVLQTFPTGSNTYGLASFSDSPTQVNSSGLWRGYTDIDVSFSTEECINQVYVKWLRYDVGTDTTTEVTYGPYEDAASIAEWGPRQATFTIHGATEVEANIAAYAADVLTANATPAVKVNSLAFKVKDQDTLNAAVWNDLNEKTDVVWQGVTYTSRINGIEHSITPEDWTVRLTMASEDTVAAPTWVPSPPVESITEQPFAIGYRTTTAGSYASGSWLAYGTADSQVLRGGITYNGATGAYTVPRDGVYTITGQVGWAVNTTAWRGIALTVGGVAHYGYAAAVTGTATIPHVTFTKYLTAGSVITPTMRQQSGGNLALDLTAGYGFISIAWVGP